MTQCMALSLLSLSLVHIPQLLSGLLLTALVHLSSHPLSSSPYLDKTQEFQLVFSTEFWKLPTSLDPIRI